MPLSLREDKTLDGILCFHSFCLHSCLIISYLDHCISLLNDLFASYSSPSKVHALVSSLPAHCNFWENYKVMDERGMVWLEMV
jgi:hypothetical protein